MRVLEALKILEDAVLDCKNRSIDTPEVHAALDAVDPYVSPAWYVQNFRIYATSGNSDLIEREGQQELMGNNGVGRWL